MNSIENTLHSPTGHYFKNKHIGEETKGVGGVDVRLETPEVFC